MEEKQILSLDEAIKIDEASEERIYVNDEVYETTDPSAIEFMEKLFKLAETDIDKYERNLKRYCWTLRRQLKINNVLWCTLSKEKDKAYIFTFPVEATLNNFGVIKLDEIGKPYLHLSEMISKEECQL
jgi:hypothetical protein